MAQTQLYRKKAQVFVIEETVQDTYLVQTAASAILAEIPDAPLTIDGANYEPTTVRGDFLSQDEVPGNAVGTISFRVPCHGDGAGTAGVAPEFGEALKACGYEETVVASTSVTYTPLSTFDGTGGNPGPSYSVTVVEDGVSYRIKGAFGNVVFNGVVGEPLFLEFTFTGAYQAVVDDALESTSYDVGISPTFQGATFATNFGGAYTPKGVNNYTLDTGNQVVAVADINDASGIYGARITGRKSIGSFDPETVLVATDNPFADWRAGTTGTIVTGVIGSSASNRYALNVNRCVYRPPELGDRDGIRINTLNFAVSSAATDVEGTNADIALIFT